MERVCAAVGVTSRVHNGQHVIMIDVDGHRSVRNMQRELRTLFPRHHIFIFQSRKGYHVIVPHIYQFKDAYDKLGAGFAAGLEDWEHCFIGYERGYWVLREFGKYKDQDVIPVACYLHPGQTRRYSPSHLLFYARMFGFRIESDFNMEMVMYGC